MKYIVNKIKCTFGQKKKKKEFTCFGQKKKKEFARFGQSTRLITCATTSDGNLQGTSVSRVQRSQHTYRSHIFIHAHYGSEGLAARMVHMDVGQKAMIRLTFRNFGWLPVPRILEQ